MLLHTLCKYQCATLLLWGWLLGVFVQILGSLSADWCSKISKMTELHPNTSQCPLSVSSYLQHCRSEVATDQCGGLCVGSQQVPSYWNIGFIFFKPISVSKRCDVCVIQLEVWILFSVLSNKWRVMKWATCPGTSCNEFLGLFSCEFSEKSWPF